MIKLNCKLSKKNDDRVILYQFLAMLPYLKDRCNPEVILNFCNNLKKSKLITKPGLIKMKKRMK